MTYTFKLARRLAVSRPLVLLPVLLIVAACSGNDATAPDGSPAESPTAGTQWRPRDLIPVAVRVNPSSVTLETNQLILFRAHGRTSAGDSVGTAVTWSTTGGTILPDGRFSAAAIGTYTITGRNRVRGQVQADSAVVVVVRRQHHLASVQVTPGSATLTPGVSRTFTAIGRLISGRTVPIGVNWSASGGVIDGGGTYVAGDTAGTYRVIATNTAGTLADSATVIISAPALPPPAPVFQKITLVPASVTLAPSATKQFSVYGQTPAGDSVAIDAAFTVSGGTISANGLYTAGSSAGTFRVIATSGALIDTSTVTVTVPLGSGSGFGVPYGPFNLYGGGEAGPPSWSSPLTLGTESFDLSTDFFAPEGALARISSAREHHLKLLTNMTGGSHSTYTTNGQFDLAKWKAAMDRYNTPEIKAAVAAAVADGIMLGNSVMDEPNHSSWGGVMTKPLLDQMCGYVKNIFPTLPVGVVIVHWWRPAERYQVCDFIIDQYDWWQSPNGPGGGQSGNITGWRDAALSMAAANGISIGFSMNLLDGGIQDITQPIEWNCPLETTGGVGLRSPTCRMHWTQVRDWGLILGPAGCLVTMWRYDAAFMSNPDNQRAFKEVATRMESLPKKSCRRPQP